MLSGRMALPFLRRQGVAFVAIAADGSIHRDVAAGR
jgi:hypothetical protein